MLFLIGYVLLIFSLSTRAYMKPPGPEFHYKDKVAHLCEYSVLGMLLWGALGARSERSERARALTLLMLVAIGASVGATDEMIQGFVPGRSKDIFDWIADTIGVSIGVSAFLFTRARLARPGGVTA